jgi:hypothetical protein
VCLYVCAITETERECVHPMNLAALAGGQQSHHVVHARNK